MSTEHEKAGSKKIQAYSLKKSPFFTKDFTKTRVPAMNLALSGDLGGGLTDGLTVLAGPSKHFKSNIGLVQVEAYLRKHPDATCIFYDSEFGIPPDYWESQGVDPDQIVHVPIMNIEQLKFDVAQRLDNMSKQKESERDNVIIFIDSIGNLASKKEAEDAVNENSAADMSRAKAVKSLFRIVTPYLTQLRIPMVVVAHTYDTMDMFPKKVVSGGCLTWDHLVRMSDGTCKLISDIQAGDEVETPDGAKQVTHAWNPDTLFEGRPETVRVTFSDGSVVECSEDHRVMLVDDSWEFVENLRLGLDKVKALASDDSYLTATKIEKAGVKPVYDISVEDNNQYILDNGTVHHNTGITYSADTVIIVGRQQEKEGAEVIGYNFIMNIEKSRFVKEKSKIPLNVTYEGGISPFSGLWDIAVELGWIRSPSQAWYVRCFPNHETGEMEAEEKKWRRKEAENNMDFWRDILQNETFKQQVHEKYRVAKPAPTDDSINRELEELL